jgi:putative membrane protein
VIEKPRFLDEPIPEPDHDATISSSETHSSGPREIPELSRPVLLDHDPNGPDNLPRPEAIQSLPIHTSTIGTGILLLMGLGGLALSWLTLSTISFVIREYRLDHTLGIADGIFSSICFSILGVAILREFWSWRLLGQIDKLRAIISSPISRLEPVCSAALEWVDLISKTLVDPADTKRIIKSSESVEEIRAFLRSSVVKVLDDAVEARTKQAIFQIGAVTAISPHLSWDGIVLLLRSLILVRQIAIIYGVRPGLAATVAILRHVVITAAATSIALSVGGKLFGGLAKATPIVREFTEAAGVGIAESARIWGLAKLTAEICNPVPKH